MSLALSEIEALTQDWWEPGSQDQYFKGNALLYRLLKKKKTWNGGVYLRTVLEYGEPQGGAFNSMSKFQTTKIEVANAARYPYASYYEPVTFDINDKIQNAGDAAQVNLLAMKLNSAQKKIRQSMALDFYNLTNATNTTGRGILGLPIMLDTSTTAYGQISSADIAEWAPGYVASSAQPLSYAVIRALRTGCQVGDGIEDMPSILVTTRTLFDVVEGQTQVNQRYEEAELADVGFRNLIINGIPVVSDYLCPSGYMYAVNENFVEMKSHKDFFFKREPWMRPTDQYIYTTQLIWVGQWITKRRNAQGMVLNLT